MQKEDLSNDTNKTLTRAEILNFEPIPKLITLPSGEVVKVGYLAYFLVKEIYKEETDLDQTKLLFTSNVIKWMLKNNDKQDYSTFSEIDQERLIEIAVDEWGCRKEYESLDPNTNLELRFYKAVRNHEDELIKSLSESITKTTNTLIKTISPLTNLQTGMISMLSDFVDTLNNNNIVKISNSLININHDVIIRIREISELLTPIIKISSEMTGITEKLLTQYDLKLIKGFENVFLPYEKLIKYTSSLETFSILPDSVRYYPTIEVHNSSLITRKLISEKGSQPIYEEIIFPESKKLFEWLKKLDPSFPDMLKGAEQTIFSSNPDRWRHFASSHRELCTQIIHKLAPDDQVRMWTNDPNSYCQGRPTRKTRLLFIGRNHKNTHFLEFIIADFINQIDILNIEEHALPSNYSKEILILLHKRFISGLLFLMEIVISYS